MHCNNTLNSSSISIINSGIIDIVCLSTVLILHLHLPDTSTYNLCINHLVIMLIIMILFHGQCFYYVEMLTVLLFG